MVGFHLVPGDYPGMGQVGSYTNVSDTDECGRLCLLNTAGCRSYEYSRTERRCNLNIVDAPTKGVYKDYAFCVYPGDESYKIIVVWISKISYFYNWKIMCYNSTIYDECQTQLAKVFTLP